MDLLFILNTLCTYKTQERSRSFLNYKTTDWLLNKFQISPVTLLPIDRHILPWCACSSVRTRATTPALHYYACEGNIFFAAHFSVQIQDSFSSILLLHKVRHTAVGRAASVLTTNNIYLDNEYLNQDHHLLLPHLQSHCFLHGTARSPGLWTTICVSRKYIE